MSCYGRWGRASGGMQQARGVAVAGLLALAIACGGGGGDGATPPSSRAERLDVRISFDTMHIGDAARATATARDAAGQAIASPDPTWSSSAPGVATVSPFGIVNAVGLGTTIIRATAGGVSGEVTVQVVKVAVALVEVTPSGITLAPGESGHLAAVPRDAAGRPLSGRRIDWLSSDTARVAVDDSGGVRAVAPGIASVSALVEGIYTSVDVRVSGPAGPVATVTTQPLAATLSLGRTLQLAARLEDAEGDLATDRLVRWSTSDPAVATVSETGLVNAVAAGAVVVTATAEGVAGTAAITVLDPADAIDVGIAAPVKDEIVGDTLDAIVVATGRRPIVRVSAKLASHVGDFTFGRINDRLSAWRLFMDLTDVRFGPYELVVTATDSEGHTGVATVVVKRGTREGKGGTTLPPRPR